MQMAFGEGHARLVDGVARDWRSSSVRLLREEARAAACAIQGVCRRGRKVHVFREVRLR
jgi:hypothetical protein